MPKPNYDVLVVGAGPAGMFACYELLKKRKKLKIALIDMGHRIEKRKPSEVMSGFGGAGTFSDGKLHLVSNTKIFWNMLIQYLLSLVWMQSISQKKQKI